MNNQPSTTWDTIKQLGVSGTSASIAEAITLPLDTAKVATTGKYFRWYSVHAAFVSLHAELPHTCLCIQGVSALQSRCLSLHVCDAH